MLTPPAALHALLFASGGPVEKEKLREFFELDARALDLIIRTLAVLLAESGVTVVATNTTVELRTNPEAAPVVKKLRDGELSRDLGKASLETLAVIAYQESATRSEIDWVRGVNSTTALRTLLMRGLIQGSEDENDKRRMRYSVTTEALAHLGVKNSSELPRASELSRAVKEIVEASEAGAEGASLE